jgi:hypothetical protein
MRPSRVTYLSAVLRANSRNASSLEDAVGRDWLVAGGAGGDGGSDLPAGEVLIGEPEVGSFNVFRIKASSFAGL